MPLGLFFPILHCPAAPQIFIGYLPCPFQCADSTAVPGGGHATKTIHSEYTPCVGHVSHQQSLQKTEDQSVTESFPPQINLF